MLARRRRLYSNLALILIAIAMGSVIQAMGWAQTSSYALVRALERGTAVIDPYAWETRDTSWTDGHFYSVKAPGMALLVLPFDRAFKAVGLDQIGPAMATRAHEAGAWRWARAGVPSGQYVKKLTLARETRDRITNYTPYVWLLSLLACVIPAYLLMLMIRALGDQLAPGYGTLAAVATGAGTLILPFSTLFFSHVISAAMVFGAFALLWRERGSDRERRWWLFAAGLLGGLAITTEYPLGLAAVIVGIYGLARYGVGDRRRLFSRAGAYAAGGVLGVLPLAIYNVLSFGSLTYFSYENAVAEQGASGHDVLGLNDGGFFGITAPRLSSGFDLLFSVKGLFALSPVLLLAFYGLVLMWRAGRRAEVWTIGSIFAAYLIYNAGYWLPFGGGSPGPRFLIPVIPFLGLALAPAFRRLPLTAIALTVASTLVLATATITLPMIGNGDVGLWPDAIDRVNFEQTWLSGLGVDNNWWGILPFVIPLVAGLIAAVLASHPLAARARDAAIGAAAVLAWAGWSMIAPHRPDAVVAGPEHPWAPFVIIVAAISLLTIPLVSALARRTGGEVVDDEVAGGAA